MYFKNIQELESWTKESVMEEYNESISLEWGTDHAGRKTLCGQLICEKGRESEWESTYKFTFLSQSIGFFFIDGFTRDVFFLEEGIEL